MNNGQLEQWENSVVGHITTHINNEIDKCIASTISYGLKDYNIDINIEKIVDTLKKTEKYSWHDLRKNPNDLPSEDGWVSCWLRNENINYGMDLFFKDSNKKFIDNRRKSIFETYKVLDFFGKQIFTSVEVDRTGSVIAWRYIEPFEEQ